MTPKVKLPLEALHELECWAGGANDCYFTSPNLGALMGRRESISRATAKLPRAPGSVLDIGCGAGHDLAVYREVFPTAHLCGAEPCAAARDAARVLLPLGIEVQEGTVYSPSGRYDLVQTHGVLIHVPPEAVHLAYQGIARVVGSHLLLMEYRAEIPDGGACHAVNGCWRRNYGYEVLAALGEARVADEGALSDGCYFWLIERTRR